MIKKIFIVFVVSLIYPGSNVSFSQQLQKENKPEQYRVTHWSTSDGLSGDFVNVMFKDIKGFLWVGGHGAELCRFDGSEFKKYPPEDVKSGSINSDSVTLFEEDSLHNIWIGTNEGVSRYDIKADTFTNLSPYIDAPFTELHTRRMVIPFWATRDSMYCIEPGGLITAFNVHSLARKVLVKLAKEDYPKVGWNTNQAFFDERSKSIWVLRHNAGTLQQIFLDGKTTYYSWDCYRKNVTHMRHSAEDMHYDAKRNSIWINSGEGLLEFSLNDKRFYHVDALNDLIKSKDYDRFVGIDIDQKGRIWFATDLKGILIYDPETRDLQPVFSDPALQQQTGEHNLHIYFDRDGIIWTSNFNGLGIYQITPLHLIAKRYNANSHSKDSLSSSLISTILPGPNGKLWIGTADGLNIFDPKTETFEVLRKNDLPGLEGTAIIPVYIDTILQKAWLRAGAQNVYEYFSMKMYEMDLRTRQCRSITLRDGVRLLDASKITIAHSWFRPYKDGILFCEENHGVFEIKKGDLVANLLIPLISGPGGFGIFTLVDDRYIFLTGSLPNFVFENKNGKWRRIVHPSDSLSYSALLYDKKDKTYWVSLKKELAHYDSKFRLLRSYGEEAGFGGIILSMEMDGDGNLWFVTVSKKLGRFNKTTGHFSFLSAIDGYLKQDYYWGAPSAKDAMGNLYFGIGHKWGLAAPHWGLDRVNPKQSSSNVTSSIYLRDISINQDPYSLSTDVDLLNELSLKYNQNTIRVVTGVIDFVSAQKNQIRYKLERRGKVAGWEYTNDRIIRYEDLPTGSYLLSIQAASANEEFNSPVRLLKINIAVPFWQTWWFWLISILFFVDLTYTMVRWRLRQKFKLQLERSENKTQMAEMRQKTAELLQQKTEVEMQALRAQMNPHFIFNSLNSINRFILQNNRAQASEYLTKFSKLVRMILQNSQASLISLESELESLNLYLDLEAVRFEHRFAYKISYPKDLDIEVLKVPPLVIQPFAENAIWHGLMHKEDKGRLDIDVSEDQDHLYIKITDNGIGRKKAAELASKSAAKHKSMGLRITKDRIAMLQKSNGGESPVEIIDLANEDGSAAGTEVIIKMPVIYE